MPTRSTSSPVRLGLAARKSFLSMLAMTCNVTRSAKAAGVHTSRIYEERMARAEFRADYSACLAEGYVRVEAELLADAIRPVRAPATALAAKERERVTRLRLSLLNAHRSEVRGHFNAESEQQLQRSAKEELIARLDEMAGRAADDHE